MAHIGFTPQSEQQLGGHVQGRGERADDSSTMPKPAKMQGLRGGARDGSGDVHAGYG